jgi:SAM-dependent methyltransferase
MVSDRSARTTFDGVAKTYDQARPGYPEQLYEDLIALSGIPRTGRILEVGCGPGKATLPLARRGYAMLCVELGADLAALARENCRPYPRVEILHTSFEDWPLEERAFDLVFSAQAWHWIPPEVGYAKTAAALKDAGALALAWNHSPLPDTPLFEATQQAYRQYAPELTRSEPRPTAEELIERTVNEIDASGLFREVQVRRYPWTERYTADQYVKLMHTFSDHVRLGKDAFQRLCAGVREAIARFGGVVTKPYLSLLYVANVRRPQPRVI